MYISVVRPSDGKFATIFDDITERKRAEQQVQHLAYSDTLTGLPNRALLMHQLRDALARCERDGTQLAVLFLDLDRFKPINDTMGHAVGDELLKAVAQRLRNAVRRSDTVSRLGGDEFVVVLGGIRGHREATRAAQEILDRIAEPFVCDQHEIFSSMSIGIAIYPADGRDAGTLLKSADMAMYVAKQRGRGNYQFYSHQMNQAAQERLELENSLRRALKQQEFSLWYQPQVNLDDGRVTGVEALIRWHHPELGIVPPGLFIPACEEIGLILPLGEWVMRSACRQAKAWTRAGHPPIRMAVNLSLVQFRQSDLAQRVRTIVEETAVDPACIELELTESMIMEDAEATVRTLRELKAMGLRLAIDDFGTGYSSLSYLSSFPIDRIKIAQRFVTDVAGDPRSAAIVETIIAIARSLGIEVIAEGVETARQLEFLRSRGCVELQGYYFSRPVPGDALTARLAEWLGPAGCCPVGVA
jgi:diguanylate cyclase (GGDEF)-like protein